MNEMDCGLGFFGRIAKRGLIVAGIVACFWASPAMLQAQWASGSGGAIYYNGGSVGVGTASPTAKLDILSGGDNTNLKFEGTTGKFVLWPYYNYSGNYLGSLLESMNAAENAYTPMTLIGSTLKLETNGGPINMSAAGGNVEIDGVTLGTSQWAYTGLLSLNNPNGNENYLNIFQFRNASGSNWLTATTRIQEITDVTNLGYIDFNPTNGPGALAFGSNGSEFLRMVSGGNVGIRTTNPQYPLSVNGTIQAKEVIVNTGWSDYVFDPGYHVRSLGSTAAYIKQYHHLPDIPSEADVERNGVPVGEMESKLLAKVEELTLQMIELDQKNKQLQERVQQLEGR